MRELHCNNIAKNLKNHFVKLIEFNKYDETLNYLEQTEVITHDGDW